MKGNNYFFLWLGFIIGVVIMGITLGIASNKRIKVRELERNSVFYIESSDKYNALDTVRINMNTLKVDAKDSTAMLCVIEKTN